MATLFGLVYFPTPMRLIPLSIVILIAIFSTISSASIAVVSTELSASIAVVSTELSASIAVVSTELDDRQISSVEFTGLKHVDEKFILNNIRTTVGDPFDASVLMEDDRRLTRLGQFKTIDANAYLQEDGTIRVVFVFVEQKIITSVAVVGNKLIGDRELLDVVPVLPGTARDTFLIDRGRRAIIEMYRERGNYLVEVELDKQELENAGVLIYKIMEGPRVRVKSVSFEGNNSFPSKQLASEIKTSVAVPFFRLGELDELILDDDVATLVGFYRDRGFLDTRIDRSIMLSPNNRDARVTFLVDEGPQYTLGEVSAVSFHGQPLVVFTSEQIAALIPMKIGDAYRSSEVSKSIDKITDAYGTLGHVEMHAIANPIHAGPEPVINLLITVDEGVSAKVGLVHIKGNKLTKDEVIRGRIRLRPGRRFDGAEPERAKDRLRETRLFSDVKTTILQEKPDQPGYRDLLVEVKEAQTGSMGFGLIGGSDSGILGNITLNQRNFDVADLPESWSEFWQGKAFRGAGQNFSMAFQPGDELFNYQISLSDQRFLQTDYSLGGTAGWTRRTFKDYDEEKTYSRVSLGRRFGDIWSGSVHMSVNRVELTDIDNDVPLEIFNDRGPAMNNYIGITATRTTLKPFARPQEGSRFKLSIDQYGVPGGDYTFTRTSTSYTTYFTVDRDFIGRATTLRLDGELGYIFGGDAPTYSRFHLGGRSFRGFDYRTISPKGTPRFAGGSTDIPIGGDWTIFLGAQYEFPVAGESISMVFFCDSGTVVNSPSLDDYRVSIGTGVRLHIPALGQAPLAFDFGIPIVKQDDDEKKTFSFSVQLPF